MISAPTIFWTFSTWTTAILKIESGKFSDLELQAFLFDAFEEGYGYKKNPEKDPVYKPYKEKSRAERMADPDRGINSPAFKKFMADRGM